MGVQFNIKSHTGRLCLRLAVHPATGARLTAQAAIRALAEGLPRARPLPVLSARPVILLCLSLNTQSCQELLPGGSQAWLLPQEEQQSHWKQRQRQGLLRHGY